MPKYEYQALTRTGKEKSGSIYAVDLCDAITRLRKRNLFPIRINNPDGIEFSPHQRTECKRRFNPIVHIPPVAFFYRMRRHYLLWRIHVNQEKRRRKLLPRKEEIINRTFAILDAHLREACIARPGEQTPPDNPSASWFGRVLLAHKGEGWPQWTPPGKNYPVPLTPLVQFNLSEAPYVPDKLKRFQLITVFIDEERLPSKGPNGTGWVVRAYESLDSLVPLGQPPHRFGIQPFPIQWESVKDEAPCWEDAWRITDLSEFNVIKDRGKYNDRYNNSEHTKIGGYPTVIQGECRFGIDDFVFQIGSEETAQWFWGDSGIGYFGLSDEGEWVYEWSCY